MAKNKSIFTVRNIIIGLGLGIVVSILLKKKDKSDADITDVLDLNNPNSSNCPVDTYGVLPPAYSINDSKVLSKKIPAVFEYETVLLQRRLNKRNACLKVDGIFEDKTEQAVKNLTGSSSITLQTLNFYGI